MALLVMLLARHRRQVSASEGVHWVVERAVALVVLPARRRRHVYWLLAFVLDSISSSVVSLLVSVLEHVVRCVVSLPVEYRPRISCAARRDRLLETSSVT